MNDKELRLQLAYAQMKRISVQRELAKRDSFGISAASIHAMKSRIEDCDARIAEIEGELAGGAADDS